MTTPWETIDDDYRNYLERSGYTADDFNSPSFDRANALNNFDQFKQQQLPSQQQQQQQQ
eukprot:CAMPEP_0172469254 /NCGR_PEP_ID=MMETSP1065-20121228/63329_1 /TAXON_ID=265537 /ORGANISM="Amphiprora paludosa, Strain CCMP125" /LENGTH=58 /DNA_ID=CAMNT_0013226881 /DNA_START=137 /DNA_END=310 /DNA_ORIENTATION=+